MTKLFRGGVPTDTEVELLLKGVNPVKGDVYTYDVLAAIAGCEVGSTRLRTVLCRWRRHLASHLNLETAAVPRHGIEVLRDGKRLVVGVDRFSRGRRAMGRALTVVAGADSSLLTDEERARQSSATREIYATLEQARRSAKVIATAGEVASVTSPVKAVGQSSR